MANLGDKITYLKGVGEKRAEVYEKLGIFTIEDLLYHFPRSYIDYTTPVAIADTLLDEANVIEVVITKKLREQHIRRNFSIYKAVATDGTDDITIVIYNSGYMFKQLNEGETYLLYGKVTGNLTRREITTPIILSAQSPERVSPVYPLTEGLSQPAVRQTMKNAITTMDFELFEPLPNGVRLENELCSLRYALENIHFPKDLECLAIARKRLVFDELLTLQLGMLRLKSRNRARTGAQMKSVSIDEFYRSLPFELTNAQKSAIADATQDMQGATPMNRLIQGDVGSGKTAVAAACCYFAHKNGCQSALMAPTEILASQHFATLSEFLSPLGVKICLLTGGLTPKQKNLIKEDIKNGVYSVIVGTHALVQQSTEFSRLGLVITDEQHRFGVKQRAILVEKGANPHTMVMSATPIPRTMALIIYGDLDISVLNELPKGRQPIETYAVMGGLRARAFKFVRDRLSEGRQGYIICPMIEDNDMELQSVTSYAEKLRRGPFADFRVGILHGKMTNVQKDEVMTSFKAHDIDLLVSTTVVEVGVDVPNAVVILIENSDRFGLSQLHQLRGRVGRGQHKSYCILVTDNATEECRRRMKIMSSTSDGFKISEEDLNMRGPGDFFGARQHGLPSLKLADMANDIEVLRRTQETARSILDYDPELSAPENSGLKHRVDKLFDDKTAMN